MMPISDTLTRRLDAAKQAVAPDPLATSPISARVRNQFLHALWGLLNRLPVDDWHAIIEVLRSRWDAERGVYDPDIDRETPSSLRHATIDLFLASSDDEARDFIEISCSLANKEIRGHFVRRRESEIPIKRMIEETNTRLREARLSYRFEEQLDQLIDIGSEYTHESLIRPALNLLTLAGFEVAKQEFATAFDHFGDGDWKDSITSAGRAFEATMKAICTVRRWSFDPAKARANDLVTVCLNNGLLPSWYTQSAQAFVAMMKAGVPHVRNNAGAHGQAPDDDAVTEAIARYAINQAACSILLLLERHRDMASTSAR